MTKPSFIEVCAGCGGLSTGLINAGFEPILLNDNDKDCCDSLRKNHPGVKVVCNSFTEIDFSQYRKKITLLAGGVPCQSFSFAGKGEGLKDQRGNLLLEFVKVAIDIRPKFLLIENVKGLLSNNKGETIKIIIKHLEALFEVSYKVLNANDFGVAQKRERLFIVGKLRDKIAENLSYTDTNIDDWDEDNDTEDNDLETRNESAHYGNYSFPKPHNEKLVLRDVLKNVPKSEGNQYSTEKKELFKMIPPGGCWINLPEELQKSYLGSSYSSGGGKRGILRRISYDEPCLTLLCSPSQKQTERCHPEECRPFTIAEYKRIQDFPDDYEICGGKTSQYKQIGNAVPIKLAKEIGQSIKNRLISTKMEDYASGIRNIIQELFANEDDEKLLDDVLLRDFIKENTKLFKAEKKIKQLWMKIGNLWQKAIGLYPGFKDLRQGHETKVDLQNEERKIFIELKHNEERIDYSNLFALKKKYPEYTCIYGITNGSKNEEMEKDGEKIVCLSGEKLFEYVFQENTYFIFNTIKKYLKPHLNNLSKEDFF